jgi:hypothetical protein
MRWTDDGVTLDILAPSLPTLVDTGDDINENSVVTRLTYVHELRTFRELLMGDVGEASEGRLFADGIALRADVPTSRCADVPMCSKSVITAHNTPQRPHSSLPFSHGPRSSP